MITSWIPRESREAPHPKVAEWAVPQASRRVKPAFVPQEKKSSFRAPVLPSASPDPVALEQHTLLDLETDEAARDAMAPRGAGDIRESEPDRAALEALDAQRELLSSAFRELVQAHEQEKSWMTRQAVEIGLAVAGELAAGAIRIEPERVADLVSQALALLVDERRVRVRLHPEIHNRLRQAGQLETLGTDGRVEVVEDAGVGEPGCIVDSDERRVDARVRSRLEHIQYLLDQPGEDLG